MINLERYRFEIVDLIKKNNYSLGLALTMFYETKNEVVGCPESIISWLLSESILDREEAKYLGAVIKPFRKRIKYISKRENTLGQEFIIIRLTDDYLTLPFFKKGTKYKNMGLRLKYLPVELGL